MGHGGLESLSDWNERPQVGGDSVVLREVVRFNGKDGRCHWTGYWLEIDWREGCHWRRRTVHWREGPSWQ